MPTVRITVAACFVLLGCALVLPAGCTTSRESSLRPVSANSSFDLAGDRPPEPRTLYTMSRILARQGRRSEAQRLLLEALQQCNTYVPAYVALAELEIAAGQPEKALQHLRKGVAACPGEPVLHNDLGMCYLARADYQPAFERFSRAVELDPLVPRYRANRAMALGLLGRYEQCLAAYSTVVSPAEAHHNLAVLCRMRGDPERAQLEHQESVHAQSPDSPAAVSAVELGTQALSVPAAPVAFPAATSVPDP